MNCVQAREHLAELLDPRNSTPDTATVRAHVAVCATCQRELTELRQTLAALDTLPTARPTPRLRESFYAMLAEEKTCAANSPRAVARPRRATFRWTWILSPLAACALLALGFVVGQRSGPTPAPTNEPDLATQRQLAELQHKVDSMGQLVSYSLLRQQPANQRLRGVLATQDLASPNDQVLTQLISALALDPSTNVRLTALDSLYPHADKDVVRAGVLASLEREQNPLVQVAMIDFLVAARDREAVPAFEQLSRRDNINTSVRDAARRALAQL
ncbi:MAG: HEAT repeat domain-containing protein [Opitutaceae bacterium]|nr:HEAT repeat domain-containing protein [Opitutaceae bacterium]